MSDGQHRVEFGMRIDAIFNQHQLSTLLDEEHRENLTSVTWHSLNYEERCKVLETLLRASNGNEIDKVLRFTPAEDLEDDFPDGDLAGDPLNGYYRAKQLLKRAEKEDFTVQQENIINAASSISKRNTISKLLRGFPDLMDKRFASPYRESFINSMVRGGITKFLQIVGESKVSMKVAVAIYKDLFERHNTDYKVSFGWNTVRAYEKNHFAEVVRDNPSVNFGVASNIQDGTFIKWWAGNMCTQEMILGASEDMKDSIQHSPELRDLLGISNDDNLGAYNCGWTYYLPRTPAGLKFCREWSKLKRPVIATSYMMAFPKHHSVNVINDVPTYYGQQEASMIRADEMVGAIE